MNSIATHRPYWPYLVIAILVTSTLFSSKTAIAESRVVLPELVKPDELGLEALLKVKVTTASRKTQSLQDVAAAAFVITHDDIERSGATSIPEVLRMAPGVNVARIASNRWAVSARGFNGRFSNKLLVLMDGRAIYSPLFSGVIWEAEDTLLEDVDRIEVIRGSGAAMWGANAVNGVINIITRKARDTQGSMLVAGVGTEDHAFGAFRHGGKAGDGYYRVWGKALSRDESTDLAGKNSNDNSNTGRIGFRGDWPLNDGNSLMVSGAAYNSPSGDRLDVPDVASAQGFTPRNINQTNKGGHVLARHEWLLDDGDEASLQGYVDHSELSLQNTIHEQRTTVDLDFQHRFSPAPKHDLIWGSGYRLSHDNIDALGMMSILPKHSDFKIANVFVQDEISLLPDTLRLTLGVRLEHNSYTGLEAQPNTRIIWTPNPNQTLWGSVSRAVRTPSRTELNSQLDLFVLPDPLGLGVPARVRYMPSADQTLLAEKVTAFEVGYRHQWTPQLSLDAALFYNNSNDLRSANLGIPQLPSLSVPYILQPVIPNNSLSARSHGLELVLDYQPLTWWRIQPTYSYLNVSSNAPSGDQIDQHNAANNADNAPKHQFSLRSSMTLAEHRQLDIWLRHMSALGNRVDGYSALDVRYAWQPMRNLELSMVGQNLLDHRHQEFVPDLLPSQSLQVERSLYFKAKWDF